MSERMARLGILAGVLLCVDTAMALMGSYEKAVWLFLPMMIGIPIMFLGVVGLNPHRRRVALTAMAGVGLLGCVLGAVDLAAVYMDWRSSGAFNLHNARIVGLMVLICMVVSVAFQYGGLLRRFGRMRRQSTN